MTRGMRIIILSVIAALLAACQTATHNSPPLRASFAQAGFERVTDQGYDGAVYMCRQDKCGALVVAVVKGEDMTPPPGEKLTAEEAIRADIYKESGVRAIFARAFSEQGNKIQITSFRLIPKTAEVRFGVRATDKGAVGSGIIRVRGNHMGILLVLSDNQATVQRYLRSQWVP